MTCANSAAGTPRDLETAGNLTITRSAKRHLIQVVAKDLRPRRVAQFRHRLGLDLPDAFARDSVHLTDFVEGARLAVGQPEPQPDDTGLALRERLQYLLKLVLQQRERDGVHGHDG